MAQSIFGWANYIKDISMKLSRVSFLVLMAVVGNAAQASVWEDIKNYFQGAVDSAKAQATTYALKKIVESNISLFNKQQPTESDVANFIKGYGYANTLLRGVTGIKLPDDAAKLIPVVLKYVAFLKPLYNQLVNNPNVAQKVVQFVNWVRENSTELQAQINQLKAVFNLPTETAQ